MHKLKFALPLIAGAFLLHAGDPIPKTAGVCFRFDDNKPPQYWREMGQLFEKHGFHMSLALVSQDLNSKEAQQTLSGLAANGHSMMDHLPNHAVYQLRARDQEEFEKYSKLPFVDHSNPENKRIYFKYELNAAHPQNRKFQGVIQNGELCKYPEDLKRQLGTTRKILIPATGQVYGISIQNGKKMLRSFWRETIPVPDAEGEMILLAANAAIQPPDDVLRFLATVSRNNFQTLGLPAPRAWIQPGGWECFVTPEKIGKIYGGEFGYISADCIPGSRSQLANAFCDPLPEQARFNMRCDFTGPDNGQDFSAMKRNIADSIAKNKVKIFISHMWVHRVKGGWNAFIKGYDELLQWLKVNKIPVRPQEEWAELLYTGKTGSNTNILPPLTRDLDGDGKPDGYRLLRGAAADLKTGTVTIPAGGKLHISDVAGLEKGANRFALSVKGRTGTVMILDFFFVFRDGKNYTERRQFRLDSDDWQTLNGSVHVKPQAVTLHYGVQFAGTGSPVEIKEPVFKQ